MGVDQASMQNSVQHATGTVISVAPHSCKSAYLHLYVHLMHYWDDDSKTVLQLLVETAFG